MFKKNVHYKKILKLSPWRKIALGTWKTVGDPSVYGHLEVDVEPVLHYLEELKKRSGKRVTVSHIVGKIVAESIKRHPEINCILRFGRLYQRESVDVFFQVASDNTGDDLSGMVIRNADQKTIIQIATEMEERVRSIKEKKDTSYSQMKNLFKLVPGCLSSCMINISSFLMYTLNLWSPL